MARNSCSSKRAPVHSCAFTITPTTAKRHANSSSNSAATVSLGAGRAIERRSRWSAASERRYSASAALPRNVTDRCTVRPDTGSAPAATRISHTPGRRSRIDPDPQEPLAETTPTTSNVGMNEGTPAEHNTGRGACRPPPKRTSLSALGGIRTPNLLIRSHL